MAPDDSKTLHHPLPVKRQHYYGGGWHPSVSGAEMPVGCPATGESLGSVSVADAQDVDRAVRAAHRVGLAAPTLEELLQQAEEACRASSH